MNLPEPTDQSPRQVSLRDEDPRWASYVWLVYLAFLFMPLVSPERNARWLWPTLVSLPVFLLLYWRVQQAFRSSGMMTPVALLEVLGIAVLGYTVTPLNYAANTYLIFAAALTPFALPGLVRPLIAVAALLGVYAIELLFLGSPMALVVTGLAGFAAAAGNFMFVQNRRKNAMLRLSHGEIRRLAMVAERERIGRDLHDLLGHTLSLIAIKSELAGKLLDRDREAAAREIADVTKIAREALKQVRTAVAGIRYAALETELASAGALLASSGVTLVCERCVAGLPPEIETVVAMIVREAVTNIQRHAGATRASIEVTVASPGGVVLVVTDDGCGGVVAHGNGLTGIGERVHLLNGTLEIESPRGSGTVLRVRLPVAVQVPPGLETMSTLGMARAPAGPNDAMVRT